jgi:hypothetical protein
VTFAVTSTVKVHSPDSDAAGPWDWTYVRIAQLTATTAVVAGRCQSRQSPYGNDFDFKLYVFAVETSGTDIVNVGPLVHIPDPYIRPTLNNTPGWLKVTRVGEGRAMLSYLASQYQKFGDQIEVVDLVASGTNLTATRRTPLLNCPPEDANGAYVGTYSGVHTSPYHPGVAFGIYSADTVDGRGKVNNYAHTLTVDGTRSTAPVKVGPTPPGGGSAGWWFHPTDGTFSHYVYYPDGVVSRYKLSGTDVVLVDGPHKAVGKQSPPFAKANDTTLSIGGLLHAPTIGYVGYHGPWPNRVSSLGTEATYVNGQHLFTVGNPLDNNPGLVIQHLPQSRSEPGTLELYEPLNDTFYTFSTSSHLRCQAISPAGRCDITDVLRDDIDPGRGEYAELNRSTTETTRLGPGFGVATNSEWDHSEPYIAVALIDDQLPMPTADTTLGAVRTRFMG